MGPPPICLRVTEMSLFRVFLGVVESAVSPGFLLISSMWYRVEEASDWFLRELSQ
jgi:hypothetical protein